MSPFGLRLYSLRACRTTIMPITLPLAVMTPRSRRANAPRARSSAVYGSMCAPTTASPLPPLVAPSSRSSSRSSIPSLRRLSSMRSLKRKPATPAYWAGLCWVWPAHSCCVTCSTACASASIITLSKTWSTTCAAMSLANSSGSPSTTSTSAPRVT